ncbi:MAG: MBL fold metallo-hydrolase [Promethearchaeota archaeon]
MKNHNLENLSIEEIYPNIYFVHQIKASAYFTRCDGLLVMPRKEWNLNPVVIDLNIEPVHIHSIFNHFNLNRYSKIDYICSHGHMDHIAHVHEWENLGAIIHSPTPHQDNLISIKAFWRSFGFIKGLNEDYASYLGDLNHYKSCKNRPLIFQPGLDLKFDCFQIQTIPLEGHSLGHVGLFFPNEKILHISCLGFDKQFPEDDQFGPWYGFEECSLELYEKDIDTAEKIFLNSADILTSSHSYVVRKKNKEPFNYMRKKIMKNRNKIEEAIKEYYKNGIKSDLVEYLLSLDLIYPKHKMDDPLSSIFRFWESWMIRNHLKYKIFSKEI